ncbi:hypothetical protein K1719_008287 [Acacia pycnantha]|nr:hypothetical protein K1719_008287 [Acacia pycnantha]
MSFRCEIQDSITHFSKFKNCVRATERDPPFRPAACQNQSFPSLSYPLLRPPSSPTYLLCYCLYHPSFLSTFYSLNSSLFLQEIELGLANHCDDYN